MSKHYFFHYKRPIDVTSLAADDTHSRFPVRMISVRRTVSVGCLIGALVSSLHVRNALAKGAGNVFLTDSLGSWQFASGSYAGPVATLPPNTIRIGGGYVSYRGGIVLQAGSDWLNWPGSWGSDIVWTGRDSPSAVLKTGGLMAFGFLLQSQHLLPEPVTVTLSTGQSITRYFDGDSSSQFFGFVGPGVSWVRVDDDAGGSFVFGDLRAVSFESVPTSGGAVIGKGQAFTAAIISGDLVANTYQDQISGPGGVNNSVGLSFDGGADYCFNTGGEPYYDECGEENGPLGDGTYSIPVSRPSIVKQVIDEIDPVDYDEPPPQFIEYTIPQPWSVFGSVMHTVYNTPAQSQCSGATQAAYVVSVVKGVCAFTSVMFPQSFVSQVQENGAGTTTSYGLVVPNTVDQLPSACNGVTRPAGSNPNNTFIEAKNVLGKCGYALTDKSEAVYPNPKKVTPGGMNAACQDTILIVDSSNSNQAIDSADDLCPACSHKSGTFISHIDDYLASNNACYATGNYSAWTANTEGETQ